MPTSRPLPSVTDRALVWVRIALVAAALNLALAPAAVAQDWTDRCQGRVEAMLLPEPLDGQTLAGDPARVRAIIVNDCDPNTVWFVVTDGNGATFLASGGEIVLDDRPAA